MLNRHLVYKVKKAIIYPMNRYLRMLLVSTAVFVFGTAVANADSIGDNKMFFVNSTFDFSGRQAIPATLHYVSSRAFVYIEDGYWNILDYTNRGILMERVSRVMSEFDNNIYPKETGLFGSEPMPGVDNNPKLTILISMLNGNIGGYFDTTNEYRKEQGAASSNEREMLYLNSASFADETRVKAFLAHEFQHLITFSQKDILRNVSEDNWLNELRSEYAVSLLGYNDVLGGSNLERRLDAYTNYPADSLTEWKNESPDYGQISMFAEYIVEHYGEKVLSDTLKTDKIGIPSLNDSLLKNGYTDTFTDVYANWMVAGMLNDTSQNNKFGYTKAGLEKFKITPSLKLNDLRDNSVFSFNLNLKDWQSEWMDISNLNPGGNPILKAVFSSPSIPSFSVYYIIVDKQGIPKLQVLNLDNNQDTLFVPNIGSEISRVIIMPIKHDRLAGFGYDELAVPLNIKISRTDSVKQAIQTSQMTANTVIAPAKPADYGLNEGDFIRAEGDVDVYIINGYGYKRIVLNPDICRMYTHLGKRGCFDAVHIVSPQTRDAFVTSNYMTNGETKDGVVYSLNQLGGDSGILKKEANNFDGFSAAGKDANSIFLINILEQKYYSR
ncbi:MAG: hypothetical protein CEN90_294 [Parcubacteria group bacterium Licking1014_17]|nr:MAG: hypothetical protein CEN90_294 [Parcubacteria group bacterium Licking1014_17]